ncbi:ubiquitin carboxyl-terminal hydrolase [Anopheles bellator]|uniref:ubiquitin carboxyl-terminal hydrolase n=1 Tax=Anopheles bellator TaxID=139047 RepID=UPI002647A898|nr:ubiquitin carboxyl-terminal hydrolase [Anopheles bellator]
MDSWLPLESNPEVLSSYMGKLGVSPLWSIVDIFGMDDELLEMVPKPVKSLIFLYPCTGDKDKEATEEVKSTGSYPEGLFFTRQYIHNACGTIALIHALLNNPDIEIEEGSVLKNYYNDAKNLSPEERGRLLDKNVEFVKAHEENAQEGQTATPALNDPVFHHFVAFVHVAGKLYELDGRKNAPIVHGDTTADTMLKDAVKVCQKYIAQDPTEVRFTLLGLAPTQ